MRAVLGPPLSASDETVRNVFPRALGLVLASDSEVNSAKLVNIIHYPDIGEHT